MTGLVNIFSYDVSPVLLLIAAVLVGMTILMVANMSLSNDKLPLFFSYIMVAILAGTLVAYYEITFQQMALALLIMVGGWFFLILRRFSVWNDKRRHHKWLSRNYNASNGGVYHG